MLFTPLILTYLSYQLSIYFFKLLVKVGNEKGVLKLFDLNSGRCTKKEVLEKSEMLLTVGDFTGMRYNNKFEFENPNRTIF